MYFSNVLPFESIKVWLWWFFSGGQNKDGYTSTLEEWVEKDEKWRVWMGGLKGLDEKKSTFGIVALPPSLVCDDWIRKSKWIGVLPDWIEHNF